MNITQKSFHKENFRSRLLIWQFLSNIQIAIISILTKLMQKGEKGTEQNTSNSFNEASITLITKPVRTVQERNLQTKLTHEHKSKNPKYKSSK